MKPETKAKSIIAAKVIGFILLLLGVLVALDFILAPSLSAVKYPYRSYSYNMVYAEKENSIDVAYVGNSQVYVGISPMRIYEEYGYTGYNVAFPLLGPKDAYDGIKDLFKTQHPKLIVLEMNPFFYDDNHVLGVARKRRLGLSAFPYIENHAYWKSGFRPPRDCTKGFTPKYTKHSFEHKEALAPTEDSYNLRPNFEKNLRKIIKLCKDNDTELLFLAMPGKNSWNYTSHNCITKFANESGFKLLDMNTGEAYEQIAIDWENDFADLSDHLNYGGAQKTTLYLGKYLSENYDLPVRKGDPNYKDWDKDLEDYYKKMENN